MDCVVGLLDPWWVVSPHQKRGSSMFESTRKSTPIISNFEDFLLDSRLLGPIANLGFKTPTPIQSKSIPILLQGRDLIGQAQTGTGKTAAFGLPLLGRINPSIKTTQALVLTPTRELAIQVARAIKEFSTDISGIRVVPIYGGQEYGTQLRALRKGAHVIVGTPGRIMDHLRRGSMMLDKLRMIVIDEADEMLNMGFIEDMEWILGRCPQERQTALFSATIPPRIRSVASKYMNQPENIHITSRSSAATTIDQRYWIVRGLNKLDGLCRILEAESMEAALIFVRTKAATVELSEQLIDRGFKASELHGDMQQKMREHTVRRLEKGQIDLLVATDVAARGLDIERFSHVINYDMPGNADSYIHRIGRTGRAGRVGKAISFVAPRERHLLKVIERLTKQTIQKMDLPSAEDLNTKRVQTFKQEIAEAVGQDDLEPFLRILHELSTEQSLDPLKIAAALAKKAQGKTPLLIKDAPVQKCRSRKTRPDRPGPKNSQRSGPEEGMEQYRLAVGYAHGANPSHIVGAIANEAGLPSRFIGRIIINEDHSLVDLPEGMPKEIFRVLERTRVCQVPLKLRLVNDQTVRAHTKTKSHTGKNASHKRKFSQKKKARL